MTKKLKLHWASSKPNFGDWLSPIIAKHLSGRAIEHSSIDKCDLLAIGSLLQRAKEGFLKRQINVWGSGFIEDQKLKKSKHLYHAVRGKKSSSLLKNKTIDCFGDPGLLIDQVYKKSSTTKTLGIVPHYKDQNNPVIQQLSQTVTNSVIVDVFEPPEEVIRQISQCEYIVSSSLHGLIMADTYQIPNQWIEVSNHVRGNGWKFYDYYSVFDIITPNAMQLSEANLSLESIITHIGDYQRTGLDSVKEALTNSFPFPKTLEI